MHDASAATPHRAVVACIEFRASTPVSPPVRLSVRARLYRGQLKFVQRTLPGAGIRHRLDGTHTVAQPGNAWIGVDHRANVERPWPATVVIGSGQQQRIRFGDGGAPERSPQPTRR